ncbi:hypothetical protein ZEAMMB73_Zm00001d011488, partial [Zea mays]
MCTVARRWHDRSRT